jgi:hypothetical protein
MERNRAAIAGIAAAATGAMAAIISASPTLSALLAQVRLAFELLAMQIGEDLAPILDGIGQLALELVDKFTSLNDSIRQPISAIIGLAVVAGVALGGLLVLGTILATIASAAVTVAGVITAGVIVAFLKFVAVAAVVVTVLTAVGAVVTGVAAVAFLAWQNNWLGIRDLTVSVLQTIQGAITAVLTFISENLVQPVAARLLEIWAIHGAALERETAETWVAIQGYVTDAIDTIQPLVTTFVDVATTVWETVLGPVLTTVAKNAFAVIKTAVVTGVDAMLTSIRVFINVLQGDWTEAWMAIAGFTARLNVRILKLVSTMIGNLSSLFGTLRTRADQWGSDLLSNFVSGLRSEVGQLDSAVSSIADRVTSALSFDLKANDRMAQQWGSDMIQEFAKGAQREQSTLSSAIPSPGNATGLAPNGRSPGTGAGPGGGAGGTTIEIVLERGAVQLRGGTGSGSGDRRVSGNEIAESVADEFEKRVN